MIQTTVSTMSGLRGRGVRRRLAGEVLVFQTQGFDVPATISVADGQRSFEDALRDDLQGLGAAA